MIRNSWRDIIGGVGIFIFTGIFSFLATITLTYMGLNGFAFSNISKGINVSLVILLVGFILIFVPAVNFSKSTDKNGN